MGFGVTSDIGLSLGSGQGLSGGSPLGRVRDGDRVKDACRTLPVEMYETSEASASRTGRALAGESSAVGGAAGFLPGLVAPPAVVPLPSSSSSDPAVKRSALALRRSRTGIWVTGRQWISHNDA